VCCNGRRRVVIVGEVHALHLLLGRVGAISEGSLCCCMLGERTETWEIWIVFSNSWIIDNFLFHKIFEFEGFSNICCVI
jgi:hypothetical protein